MELVPLFRQKLGCCSWLYTDSCRDLASGLPVRRQLVVKKDIFCLISRYSLIRRSLVSRQSVVCTGVKDLEIISLHLELKHT
jgi:hypothetical protein